MSQKLRAVCLYVLLLFCVIGKVNAEGFTIPTKFLEDLGGVRRITQSFGRLARPVVGAEDELCFEYDRRHGKYAGVMIYLKHPVSLEGQALAFEGRSRRAPGGLYVRCYNRGGTRPVWSVCSWSRMLTSRYSIFRVCRGGYGGLNWESGEVSGDQADQVDRIELIIGEQDQVPGLLDLSVRSFRLVAPPERINGLTRVVELRREFDFTGKVTIVHGNTPGGLAAARRIRDGLGGGTLKLGTQEDCVPRGQTVMLGNISDNPAMLTAYARTWAPFDRWFPGKGKYVATVLPDGFRQGEDVMLLGCSDDEGLKAGSVALANYLKKHNGKVDNFFLTNLTVPACDKDHLAKGLKVARTRLERGVHTSLGGQLESIAKQYALYRRPEDARLYVAVAKLYGESAKADPRKFGGPWGFDSDFKSFGAIFGWDVMEHDDVLTDKDRLAVSQVLGRWLQEAIAAEASGGLGGSSVVSNHLTFASLGTLAGAEYFGKYYETALEEPAQWRRIVKHNFARQSDSFKAMDDCNGYQWLTWTHLALYSLAQPESTFFTNGILEKVLRGMLMTMDNLGIQVPYGDTGSWRCWGSEMEFLKEAYAGTRAPLAAFIMKLKMGTGLMGSKSFVVDLPEAVPEPKDYRGVQCFPLDANYYGSMSRKGDVPLKRCFDKLSFRKSFDPQHFYLLLDGVNNGGHRHDDVNSILRHTQYGRIWLADNDYFKRQQKFHNSLLMTVDGQAVTVGNYAELLEYQENAIAGWSSTRMNHKLLPWTRHVVWLKDDDAYAVLDSVAPTRNLQVMLKQRWNVVGKVTEKADGYEFGQLDAVMRFQGTNLKGWNVYDDAALGKNWAGYRYAPQIVRVVDQVLGTEGKAGERIYLGGVWHGAQGKVVKPWSVTQTPSGMRISTGKRSYDIRENAEGKLTVIRQDRVVAIQERRKISASQASAGGKPMKVLFRKQHRTLKQAVSFLNELENRKKIAFDFDGVQPTGRNLLISGSPNVRSALIDGSWGSGEDSVMLKKDEIGDWTLTFRQPQVLSVVRVHSWWGVSSRGTVHKVARIRVLVDGKEVGHYDAREDHYPNFGTPVCFDVAFPAVKGRKVQVIMEPWKGGYLYVCEILAGGPPVNQSAVVESFELFNAMTELNGQLVAGTERGQLFFEDGRKTDLEKRAVHCLHAADLDGDGQQELLVGAQDRLMVFEADGKTLRWSVTIPFYRNPGTVRVIRTGDLDGDGKLEVLCGADNWRTYAFSREGKELWNYEVVHPTRAVELYDLDGDGKLEVLCGTIYYSASILNHDGHRRWRAGFGPGCETFRCLRNAAGKVMVVAGSNNGGIYFFTAEGARKQVFTTGDEVRAMVVEPMTQTLYAASFNGLLYRFNPDGKLLGLTNLQDEIRTLSEALPDGSVLAGTKNGWIYRVGTDGAIKSWAKLQGRVTGLRLRKGNRVAVITAAGEIAEIH